MPLRTIPLIIGQYYHIFNRGVARQPVFLNKRDYERFIHTLSYYRYVHPPVKLSRLLHLPKKEREKLMLSLEVKGEKMVEIICYVLMPNHFHLLLKQNTDGGISTFIRLAVNSWTRYFNTKHNRPGSLFQGAFKAVRVESDEQLIHLSRYIHLNPLVSYLVKEKDFLSYPWSSLPEFLNGTSILVNTAPVLSHFSSPGKYTEFVFNQADYGKQLEKIKHLTLEKE